MTQLEETINSILERMSATNDYIIGITGRYYWANDATPGILKEAAFSQEATAICKLAATNDKRIIYELRKNKL